LKKLELRNKTSLRKIFEALDSLEELGLKSSGIKKLKNSNGIFRKRAGRFRILFTIQDSKINVWIIGIEKDSSKDYSRWISYISREI
jgi:mRNA-degrading endonuclease RelE of RelBE toxin-antitoxin system